MTVSAEERFEIAQLTEEMLRLVERHLAEKASRQELNGWAERLIHSRGGHVFRGAAASGLLSCLLELDTQLAGKPLVRSADLAAHVDEVRIGLPPFHSGAFATLTLTPRDIAARTGTKVTRFVFDGLGWMEGVHFASLATGRRFAVHRPLYDAPAPARTSAVTAEYPSTVEERAQVLADLFDTLVIDSDDTTWSDVASSSRWRLLRGDDNGNTALVRSFTGYAKARHALAQYEGKLHKQSYWLEPGH